MSIKNAKSFLKDIKKVVNWIKTKGYDVEFSFANRDEIDIFEKEIRISSRSSIENQLYGLLHECGHLLINNNEKRYKKTYIMTNVIESRKTLHRGLFKSKQCQIDIIAEEIDAWRHGKNLAKRLKININNKSYNKEMAKHVFSYVRLAYKKIQGKKL